jgi:pilus assembly protein CpaB
MALRIPRLRINRTWAMLFLAIGLGLLATWLTLQYLKIREQRIAADLTARSKGGPGVRVVVPTRDLQRGMAVNQSVVAGREIPADLVYQETITVDMWDRYDGARLIRNVDRGRPLRLSDLQEQVKDFSKFLENGQRAITIETDEVNSIAQLVRPGNLMDLFLIMPDPSDPNASTQQIVLLMQRLKVIATGQRVRGSMDEAPPPGAAPGAPTPGARYATFTFEVTPEEAARLALAQSLGKFRAVLRNEPDKEIVKLGRINSRNLLKKVAMAPDTPEARDESQIEYIIGGRGGGGIGNTINVNMPGLGGAMPGVPGMPGMPGAGVPGQPGATGPAMGVPAGIPQMVQPFFPAVPQPPAPAQLPSNQPAPGYGPQNIAR